MPSWLVSEITTTQGGSDIAAEVSSSTTTRTAETVVQTAAEVVETSANTKTADAGVIISFSVPLRGGIYNEGTASPPL
jgi:hypothetical protein